MTVFSRWQTLGDRLTHYQYLPEASSILVIVNNQNVTLAHLPRADAYAVNVVYKFMETNSMNNRFFPWPELKYDCILIVDDDVDADLAAMSEAIHGCISRRLYIFYSHTKTRPVFMVVHHRG
jgi:hypothetical protein